MFKNKLLFFGIIGVIHKLVRNQFEQLFSVHGLAEPDYVNNHFFKIPGTDQFRCNGNIFSLFAFTGTDTLALGSIYTDMQLFNCCFGKPSVFDCGAGIGIGRFNITEA